MLPWEMELTLGAAGGTNHGMITQLQDKTSSSTRNEPTAEPTAKANKDF